MEREGRTRVRRSRTTQCGVERHAPNNVVGQVVDEAFDGISAVVEPQTGAQIDELLPILNVRDDQGCGVDCGLQATRRRNRIGAWRNDTLGRGALVAFKPDLAGKEELHAVADRLIVIRTQNADEARRVGQIKPAQRVDRHNIRQIARAIIRIAGLKDGGRRVDREFRSDPPECLDLDAARFRGWHVEGLKRRPSEFQNLEVLEFLKKQRDIDRQSVIYQSALEADFVGVDLFRKECWARPCHGCGRIKVDTARLNAVREAGVNVDRRVRERVAEARGVDQLFIIKLILEGFHEWERHRLRKVRRCRETKAAEAKDAVDQRRGHSARSDRTERCRADLVVGFGLREAALFFFPDITRAKGQLEAIDDLKRVVREDGVALCVLLEAV